jgi:hypothetical protein
MVNILIIKEGFLEIFFLEKLEKNPKIYFSTLFAI